MTLLTRFSVISLTLFIVIGALLGWDLMQYFEQQALEQQKMGISSLVTPVVGTYISRNLMEKGAHDATYDAIERALSYIGGLGLVRVKIWNQQGRVVYSDDKKLVDRSYPISDDLQKAFDGETTAEISSLDKTENAEERGYGELLEVYTPIRYTEDNTIAGAFEGYYDISDLRDRQRATTAFLWTSIVIGFLFLYVSLFTLVRSASQRILRQSNENALLLTDTRRKAARLELLNDLARQINRSSLDVNEVFRTALRGIDHIVPQTGASITLLSEATGQAVRTYSSPSAPYIDGDELLPGTLPTEVEKRLLGDEGMLVSGDTSAAGLPELEALARQNIFSIMLVGIRPGERNLGILRVVSDRRFNFSEDDASILKNIVDQLAVAMENTRLIEETAETTALREANKLKDEFVSMVSHELRTPLASIKGYSRTLLAGDGNGNWDDPTEREFVTIISEESDKLGELVENLLEMTRIEAGRLPISPEPLILWRFCGSVVDRVKNHFPAMRFNCEIDESLPMVVADPLRVEQVLANLLQNAAKYSGADLVTVGVEHQSEGEVVVYVRDNGIGIAPEHLPHLFDKFYRAETPQGDTGSGTGLGLAIVKALVEAQGGRIWVESTPGAGATFYFTLPTLPPDSEVEAERAEGEPALLRA